MPALKFTVKGLAEFVKDADNVNKARDLAVKFINGTKKFEKANDQILRIIPNIKVGRKNEKDFNLENHALAIKKLVKFLKQETQI